MMCCESRQVSKTSILRPLRLPFRRIGVRRTRERRMAAGRRLDRSPSIFAGRLSQAEFFQDFFYFLVGELVYAFVFVGVAA
jgi:hypothetical protein